MQTAKPKSHVEYVSSPSLTNGTFSPGWSELDVNILKLGIKKFGVGRWTELMASGCLPGKTKNQLMLQLQRIMGQQSLSEYMGIHLDPEAVGRANAANKYAKRKKPGGIIINDGAPINKDENAKKVEENTEKYGLPLEEIEGIDLPDRRNEYNAVFDRALKKRRLAMLQARLQTYQTRLVSLADEGANKETKNSEDKGAVLADCKDDQTTGVLMANAEENKVKVLKRKRGRKKGHTNASVYKHFYPDEKAPVEHDEDSDRKLAMALAKEEQLRALYYQSEIVHTSDYEYSDDVNADSDFQLPKTKKQRRRGRKESVEIVQERVFSTQAPTPSRRYL